MKKSLFFLLTILFIGKLYAQTELPNTISYAEKFYGLSNFWNQVNYNFVYLNKVDKKKWKSDYIKLITEVQNTKNDYDYYRLLQKFAATLKDGHTSIELPKSVAKLIVNNEFGDYKFFLENIDEKVIITKINKSKRNEIPLGTEIIEVNGYTSQEYLDKFVKPYISSNTEQLLNSFSVSQMFQLPKEIVCDIKFRKPNGKVITRKLTTNAISEKEFYPNTKTESSFEFKWLKNKTAYIALNSFGNSKIVSSFLNKLPEIKKAKKIIIDLRKNLGGDSSNAHSILKHLTHDKELVISRSQILSYNPLFEFYGVNYNIQAKDTMQGSTENRKMLSRAYLTSKDSYFYELPFNTLTNDVKTEDRIVIPTAILIGSYTASSSEDFLVATENQKHIIKVGSPTAGTTGMPMSFKLPGNGRAKICIKKEIYPDGKEFVGYGIKPNIFAKKTFQDYLKDRDPVLQKAIEYLKKK